MISFCCEIFTERSDICKTATVVDSLPKWLLSGGNLEDSGFVCFCSGRFDF